MCSLTYLKFNTYLQLPYNNVTTNTHCDKQASTSEQALWEINKLYPIDLYGILVINIQPQLCYNNNTILVLGYN